MKKILFTFLVLGVIGCSSEDDTTRLLCDCVYRIENTLKKDCETWELRPFIKNLPLVINHSKKIFTFNGIEYNNRDDSFDGYESIGPEGKRSEGSRIHDFEEIVSFSADEISHFSATLNFGTTTVFDRTNLSLIQQHWNWKYIAPGDRTGTWDGEIRVRHFIKKDLPFTYYQCAVTDGV